MASTSSTGVPPPSSPNAPAVGGGDAQQLEAESSGNDESPADMAQVPINPLLLASASFGSSRALRFLLDREDAEEPPMTFPTQVFLDNLVGWTEGSGTNTRLTVPHASDNVEHGVYQPVFSPITSHEVEDVTDQESFQSAASHSVEDGVDEPAFPAAASHEIEDVVDQESFQSAASHGVEDGGDQPAFPAEVSNEIEEVIHQESFQSATSHGLEDGGDQFALPAVSSDEIEDVVDQNSFQSAASQGVEDGGDQPALPAEVSNEIEEVVDQESFQLAASHGVQYGGDQPALATAASNEIEEVVDQESFQSAASHGIEGGGDQPALPAVASDEMEDLIDQESFQSAVSHGVEDGGDQPTLPAAAKLLKGVTAEGDTALHVVASHGDSRDFLKCVIILFMKDESLLFAVNKNGDTPMHCAARAGKATMVYGLIKLAERGTMAKSLLRKENGRKETALHDAVRAGNRRIVMYLLKADTELANYPKEGTSPLYLAILLEMDVIARTLYDESNGNLSYSGPHGQNALHAAILRGKVMTEDVLKWNNGLTTQGDRDGSTPLHFASSLHRRPGVFEPRENYTYSRFLWHSNIFKQVFEANPAPVYQADNQGLFPIHIAASLGAKGTVLTILEKCPSSAGLRDAKGRTFLHVAAEYKKLLVVSFACRTPSLVWILNMQDNDGNTALHLAVKARKIQMFCSLYANRGVHLSLTNNDGQTPLDLSTSLIRPGMFYIMNTDKLIHRALSLADAKHSGFRWDQIYEKYTNEIKPDEVIKEGDKMKESSQMFGIGSVFIASIAFRATFAVPGSYIADVQKGTQTLAGRYTFDAFVMATTIAFLCSSIAIICLMFSGTSMVDLILRRFNFNACLFAMSSAVTSLSVAFALGAYMELASVSHATAILICLISPIVVLYRNSEVLVKYCVLRGPLHIRVGPSRASCWLALNIGLRMLLDLWPFIIIFGWAAIAPHLRHHK